VVLAGRLGPGGAETTVLPAAVEVLIAV